MKSQNKFLRKSCMLFFGALTLACSKDDVGAESNNQNNGAIEVLSGAIDLNEFENDEGEIGINLSARSIAKKGYFPKQAQLIIDATTIRIDTLIPFSEFNNQINFALRNEELSGEQKAEFEDGVAILVKVFDENDNEIVSQNISKTSFVSGPPELSLSDENLEDRFGDIVVREGVPHHIQIVTEGNDDVFGAPHSILHSSTQRWVNFSPLTVSTLGETPYTQSTGSNTLENFYSYHFEKVPGETNVYTIYVVHYNIPGRKHYVFTNTSNSNGYLSIESSWRWDDRGNNITDAANRDNYKFRIEKEENGLFSIRPLDTGIPLKVETNMMTQKFIDIDTDNSTEDVTFTGLRTNDTGTATPPAYFRILSLDIEWDVQPIEAKFMQPILPPSRTSEAYNSTLRNCSSGLLTQTVGTEETREIIETVGWEESMTISTSKDYSIAVTIGVEVEGNLFGQKTTGSVEVTGSYAFSRSVSATRSEFGLLEESTSFTVSTSRNQEVPPKSAIAVADVYQEYENIRIPYVYRFRIKGTYPDINEPLTGEEIVTQFAFNGFTGVVTNVQQDFIEVTVKGINTVGRIIEIQTVSRDVEPNCDG